MAIVSGQNAGQGAVSLNDTPVAAIKLGVPATITVAAASASATIPTDANSVKYSAVLLTASTGTWFNFNTAGDAAVAGAANTYFLPGNGVPLIVVIPTVSGVTATQISAIQDSAGGKLCIIGVF